MQSPCMMLLAERVPKDDSNFGSTFRFIKAKDAMNSIAMTHLGNVLLCEVFQGINQGWGSPVLTHIAASLIGEISKTTL